MKIFFSQTQTASDVSESCEQSVYDWNSQESSKVFENEEAIFYSDNSSDEWNGRYGFIVESKKDSTKFNIHFTGRGFGWGEFYGEKNGIIISIPSGLDIDGRTVYDKIKNNPNWKEITHPILEELCRICGDGPHYPIWSLPPWSC